MHISNPTERNKVLHQLLWQLFIKQTLFYMQLACCRHFSHLSPRQIKEGDMWKTAFRCRYGHYEYQVVPFRHTNALAYFQHFMTDILKGYLDLLAVIIIDDICIYSWPRRTCSPSPPDLGSPPYKRPLRQGRDVWVLHSKYCLPRLPHLSGRRWHGSN